MGQCASMKGSDCDAPVTHRDASFLYCAECAAKRAATGTRTRKLTKREVASVAVRPSISVSFDGSPSWPAVAIVGSWNGFAVPRVTAEVREQIAAYLDVEGVDDAGAEIRAVPVDADGLVTLRGWALSATE